MPRQVCSCGKIVEGDSFMHTSCFRQESFARSRNKELVKKIVDRFLAWRFPDDICPDGGLSFTPEINGHKYEPIGTNLLSEEQAIEMIDDIIGRDKLYTQADLDKAVRERTREIASCLDRFIEEGRPLSEYIEECYPECFEKNTPET